MARIIKNLRIELPPVTAEVKPWIERDDVDDWSSYRNARENAHFQPGDVVWIAYGTEHRKAVVLDVFPESDGLASWRPKYRVVRLNQTGKTWAKTWYYTWGGVIQRGYLRAGALPPDIAALFESER